MTNYENFKKFVGTVSTGYEFENEQFLSLLANYFAGVEGKLNPKKGLLIWGTVGRGKTITLKLFQKWLPKEKKFAYTPTNKVVEEFNIEGDSYMRFFRVKKERLFDDLGAEDKAKHYGNSVEVMEKIIYSRYEMYQNERIRTHFTTNVGSKQLIELYGERAMDRLKEMCNIIVWPKGESFRLDSRFEWKEIEPVKEKEITPEEAAANFIETCFYKPYKKAVKNGGSFRCDETNAVILFRKIFIEGKKSVSNDVLQKYSTKAKEWLRTPRTDKIKKSELVKIWNDLDCLNAIDQGYDIKSDPDLRKMAAKIKKIACWLFFVDWVNQQIELGIDCETII